MKVDDDDVVLIKAIPPPDVNFLRVIAVVLTHLVFVSLVEIIP